MPALPRKLRAMTDTTSPLRRCIVSGDLLPRAMLIRFVLSPDHQICPDLDEKLPGRGVWVSCDPAILGQALRKNLFAKAMKTAVKPCPDLVERVRDQLKRRLLDRLGLARRSGVAVTGFAQIEPAARRGGLALLFLASDAGDDGRRKLMGLVPAERVITCLAAAEQAQALGQEHVVYLGIDTTAPSRLIQTLERDATRFSRFGLQEKIAPQPALAQIGDTFS